MPAAMPKAASLPGAAAKGQDALAGELRPGAAPGPEGGPPAAPAGLRRAGA